MKNLIKLIVLFGIVGILLIPIRAQALETLTFYNITNNIPGDAAIGEAQARVDVSDPGGSQVDFRFYNLGPESSSITDVYYDDGGLFGIASIDNSDPGVAFSQLASPPDLPGGNNVLPPFVVTAGFSADSDPPAQPNGVNPGESVVITFDLLPGITYAHIINNLKSPGGATPALRIGIHVQGFDTGGSEGFVNNPPNGGPGTPVPEPGSLCLALGALFLIFGIGAKRKKEV